MQVEVVPEELEEGVPAELEVLEAVDDAWGSKVERTSSWVG